MKGFRKGDLIQVTSFRVDEANSGMTLPEGLTVRVSQVHPEDPEMIKIFSSVLTAHSLGIWWDANRFVLQEAALPVEPESNHREQAEKYLKQAESRYAISSSSMSPGAIAKLGILHALLVEPEKQMNEEVTRTDGSTVSARDLLRQIEELQERDRQRLATLSDKERAISSLEGELNTANEARTELRRQLDSERIGHAGARVALGEARQEIARLNREQGIAATRKEAIAKPEGYKSTDLGATITDKDGDDAVFEWPVGGNHQFGDVLLRGSESSDGVWFKLAQLEALTTEIRERHRA